MPTENGTVLHAGRRPTRDAAVVERLRAAGAVILGKTVTTELAVYHPGKTRNPHDPERTPGGSSSGSAAAVAAGMVPLAVGSQTNGSVIRPASYCGVFGFKPSHGLISRFGVLAQSRPLDHIGVFARTLEDLALIAEPLIGFDARDRDTRLEAAPRLLEVARQDWPLAPDLALVKSPVWDQAEDDLKAAFAELAEALGARITEVDLPEAFAGAHGLHGLIMGVDLARSFAGEYARGRDQLSERLRGIIEGGQRALAIDYARALEQVPPLRDSLDPLFAALRRDRDAGHDRPGAARAEQHRQPDVLHHLDPARAAGGDPAAAHRRRRHADRRAAGRPLRRRCPAPAHGPLARVHDRRARRRARSLRKPPMEDIIAAVIGIVLMLAFAGGLAWLIGSPPLLIITAWSW